MAVQSEKPAYTVDELAKSFSVHRDMIWKIRALGELRGFRSGHRRLFTVDEVQAFLRRRSYLGRDRIYPDEPPAAAYYAQWPRERQRVVPVTGIEPVT